MEVNKNELDLERERLQRVYNLINDAIGTRDSSAQSTKREIVSMRRSFWDAIVNSNEEIENVIEIAQRINQMDQEQYKYESKKQEINKLLRLKDSPYFGRVDFIEKDEDFNEKVYIGISSFINFETGEIYIYDWRSPISSIFYEFEKGLAEYSSPMGKIQGNISLKRQFKIHENIIDYMFDSNIKIDDEILQEILSKSADDKMKNIVTTIQKEQNRIIRDDKNSLVIVQGAAGSGKTSIALHRVAYLLYRYRDRAVSSNNIVIFSPNQMFNDYISNVLPELGEENINQTTFFEYSQKFIDPMYRLEDFNEQMEYILTSNDGIDYYSRIGSIRYKASQDFLNLLKNYVVLIKKDLIKFHDIMYEDKLIISEKELSELFHKDYFVSPVSIRLKKIRERIYLNLNPAKSAKTMELTEKFKMDPECIDDPRLVARLTVMKNSKPLMDEIDQMTSFDVFKSYINLFEDKSIFEMAARGTFIPENIEEIRNDTIKSLKEKTLRYEDIPAYLYLKGELEGVPNLSSIKHIVIDEAQDYTPLQYEIFNQLFSYSNLTVLGDLNQSIHPYAHTDSYESLLNIFNVQKSSIFKLYKSYRSVKEIVEFTKQLLTHADNIEYINRPGEKPVVFELCGDKSAETAILDDMESLLSQNYKSIAVICKTEAESQEAYKNLTEEIRRRRSTLSIKSINKDSEVFTTGLVVIPSYLSKGLEFDAVIIYDASAKSYSMDEERKLFYTICTRALHRLHMYYKSELTPFVSRIDKELYNAVNIIS